MSADNETSPHSDDHAKVWQTGTYQWWPAQDRLIWSPELIRIYGLKRTPAAEQEFTELVHPEDRIRVEGVTSTFLGSDATSYSHSFRIVRPDGTVRVILDRGAIKRDVAGNVRVIHGINIDVTDETQFCTSSSGQHSAGAGVEDSFKEYETHVHLAMRAGLVIAFDWDIRADRVWRVLSSDPVLPRTFEHPDTFETVANAVHPDDRDEFRAAIETALKSTDGKYYSEHRIAGPDGIERWHSESGCVEFGDDGAPLRLRGISHDVTRRKCTEKKLAEAIALLESLFDCAPVGLGVWDREFRFLRINPELAAINGLPPDAHIGRRPDEILPKIANIDEVYRNWQRIIDTGESWRGVEITGETPAQPGLQRYWEEAFFPVRIGGCNVGIAAIVQETTRRKLAEKELSASEARYRTLFEAIDEGFCIAEFRFDDSDGRRDCRILEANAAFYEHSGLPQTILGRWLREAAPGIEEHWYEIFGCVARTGEPIRFSQSSDLIGRWFDIYAFRTGDLPDYRVAILLNDISDRKHHEDQKNLLMKEVNHRSKNMLSLVQAIARQTASSGADDFIDRFGERIQALAAAQDLVVQNSWNAVPIAELIRSQLAHFSDLVGKRIKIVGPPHLLTPDATQSLGMAIHELATNAVKYGALSNEAGNIAVNWTVEPQKSLFTLSWLEQGGPPITQPKRHGFGSRVTTEMVKSATRGDVLVEYGSLGLSWRLICPIAGVLDRSDADFITKARQTKK